MNSSTSSLVSTSGGSILRILVEAQPVNTCSSYISLCLTSFCGMSISTPIIKPLPRTSVMCDSVFCSSLSCSMKYSPTRCAFSTSPSFSKTSRTASAAEQARWFPPKVVPNLPYTGVKFGEMSSPPMGKPFPMPFATVIRSGRMSSH